LQRAQQSAPLLQIFSARVRLAQYQRLQGSQERAYSTLVAAKDLLTTDEALSAGPDATYPVLLAQLELARLQGDYTTTRQGTEVLAAYLQRIGEPYALACALLDQAFFAAQQGQWEDVPDLAQRIELAAGEVDAAYVRQRGVHLARQARDRCRPVTLIRKG
jgi:hypothetical protein